MTRQPLLFDRGAYQSPLLESWQLDASAEAYQFALAHMRELVAQIGPGELLRH